MSYLGEVLADAPLAYWRLGDAAGTTNAADASGNGRDGTYSAPGIPGEAGALATDADLSAGFDGVNEMVTLPALPALGTTWTVELWLKHQSGSDARQMLLGDDAAAIALMFGSDAKLNLRYSAADHKNSTALTANIWHHVMVVVTAGAGAFFVDGVADGTAAAVPTGFAPARIGEDTGGDTYKGWLDEVALYSTALSAARLALHYAAAWRGLISLRPRLRVELHDGDATAYRWTDAVLERHLARAVDELSEVWPDERKTGLVATIGSRDVSVASLTDLVRIEAVEYPTGNWPPTYVQWQRYGSTLTLMVDGAPSTAAALNVFWGARHVVERLTSTLPVETEDTVVLGAGAYAVLELAQYHENRANVGGPGASSQELQWASRRLAEFRTQLRRFGRAGRVRASTLYAPARSAGRSQAMDFGPV